MFTKPLPGVMDDPLHQLSQGCICHLLFNEGAGSVAYDVSGHRNHGALKNMLPNAQDSGWGGSKLGGGLSFDGANDYVDIGDMGEDAYAINIWFYAPIVLNSSTTGMTLMQLYYPRSIHGVIGIGNITGFLSAEVITIIDYVSGYERTGVCGIAIAVGWHNLLINWNATTSRYEFWLDGSKQTATDGSHGGVATVLPLSEVVIGKDKDDGYNTYNGSIDTIQIYNRALNSNEIKQIYHDPFCNLFRVPAWQRYTLAVALARSHGYIF